MANYEVFISFRNSDDNGQPTRDRDMAEALYNALQGKHIPTFYSNRSIDEAGNADYVDAIDEALDCCNILVAVGTCRENLNSVWVKNEIKQFRTDMLNGVKEQGKSAMISYRSPDFPPQKLPSGLRNMQSFTQVHEVVTFIENFRKKGSGFRDIGVPDMSYRSYANQSAPVLPRTKKQEDCFLQPGTLIDGRYRVLNLVGRGGMSYVHLAINEKTNKSFALKEIRKDGILDFATVKEGIMAETDLMRRLDHPSIPRIHDVIDNGRSIILIMDFIEGTSLNQVISKGALSEELVLNIGRQLAEALDYLHSQSRPVIYRDMKPANVIMKPDGKVMLIDFGTAREYKETATEDTTCLGTRGYAAPEQYGGMGQTDARTDIYCLGATLYHLVTGRNPCEPPYEIMPIRQINPELSYGLECIIRTCTQNDPDKRFQSAEELLDALENIDKLGNRARRQDMIHSFATKFAQAIPLTDQWMEKKRAAQKNAAPVPAPREFASSGSPIQPPKRIEGVTETTVLSPEPQPVQPQPIVHPNAFVPSAPAVRPMPVEPIPTPNPGNFTAPLPPNFCSAPTEVLDSTGILGDPAPKAVPESRPVSPPPVAKEKPVPPPAPSKPKIRKVTVRSKAVSNPELEEMITKLSALDPKSRKLVGQLIDQLSK